MRDPAPWQKKYEAIFGLSCLLGLMGQYLFVGHAAGISVPLFVLAFYGLFFYGVKGRLGGFELWRGQSRSAWLLFIPIALLTLTYVLYGNAFFRFFNAPVIIGLVIMQTVLITRSSTQPWYRPLFYRDVLLLAIAKPLSHLAVPFEIIGGLLKRKGEPSSSGAAIRKILLGLLIASPLLLIVVTLLASADSIFSSWVNEIPKGLDFLWAGDGIVRLIFAGFIALYTFCFLVGLLFRKSMEMNSLNAGTTQMRIEQPWKPSPTDEPEKKGVDPIVAGTLLISVNAVYVLFAAIQFSYLFGAAGGLLPEGVNYSEYARSGFAELVLVAMINIALLLFGLHGIREAGRLADMIRKLSLSLLVGSTVVMLVSAYSRLSLYEYAYGYTQLRLLAHGFMIYLALLLAIAFIRIWRDRLPLSKAYIAVSVAAYVGMNYLNIDARIAENNITRYEQSGIIDTGYLSTLSIDAAPALQKLHQEQPDVPGLAEAVERMQDKAAMYDSWQSWNIARMRVD